MKEHPTLLGVMRLLGLGLQPASPAPGYDLRKIFVPHPDDGRTATGPGGDLIPALRPARTGRMDSRARGETGAGLRRAEKLFRPTSAGAGRP